MRSRPAAHTPPPGVQRHRVSRKFEHETLLKDGVKNLYYVEGEPLLGDDNEGATDGSHPSDLGFMRQANVLEPVIRKAIRMK